MSPHEAELLVARKVGNVNGDKGLPESLQDNDIQELEYFIINSDTAESFHHLKNVFSDWMNEKILTLKAHENILLPTYLIDNHGFNDSVEIMSF